MVKKADIKSELPNWLKKLVNRQDALNAKYDKVHGEFAKAYNDFLITIEELNQEHGTSFSFEQAATEYQGMMAGDAYEDDEDDEDEDDEDDY